LQDQITAANPTDFVLYYSHAGGLYTHTQCLRP